MTTGAINCVDCAAGKKSDGGEHVESCTDCPAGKVSFEGATDCYDCAANTYSNSDKTECSGNCQSDKYVTRASSGATSCTSCEAADSNGIDFIPVDVNYWNSPYDDGKGKCVSCMALYQDQYRTKRVSGAIECDCMDRYTLHQGTNQCIENAKLNRKNDGTCQNGYVDNSGECTACDPGKKQNGAICDDCAAGTWQEKYAKTSCELCPKGTYSTLGSSYCTHCAAGKFAETDESTSCEDCEAGEYQPLSGQSACESCPLHSTSRRGSTGLNHCKCNADYEGMDHGHSCIACPEKTHKNTASRCQLTKISAGSQQNAILTDDESSFQCKKGFKWNTGESKCEDCEEGKFKPMKGNETFCVYKTLNSVTNPSKDDVVFDCDNADMQKADDGSERCECKIGMFHTSQNSCESCRTGTYQDQAGQSHCVQCEPGKSQNQIGETQCTTCPQGTYTTFGMSTCQHCRAAPGHYCSEAESTPDGRACPRGNYCDGGTSQPADCEPGQIPNMINTTGSSSCLDCTAGTQFSDFVCETCPENYTSFYRGTECKDYLLQGMDLCHPGFFYNRQARVCEPCTYLHDLSEYKQNWTRSFRYHTHNTSGAHGVESSWQALQREQQEYPHHRFHVRDKVWRHCSLHADAITCPQGMEYFPLKTPPCRQQPRPERTRCIEGEYYDHLTFQCHKCPRNLTTGIEEAVGVEACMFCHVGYYLLESEEDERQCLPCEKCWTTHEFGGHRVPHREQHCTARCGPVHMKANHTTCDPLECLQHVRTEDIHPCVFDVVTGTMLNGTQETDCHEFFEPLRDEWWRELYEPEGQSRDKAWPLDLDRVQGSTFLQRNREKIDKVRKQNNRNPYRDFFYTYFTTTTVTDRYAAWGEYMNDVFPPPNENGYPSTASEHVWPQILQGALVSQAPLKYAADDVISQLSTIPLLSVKHVNTASKEAMLKSEDWHGVYPSMEQEAFHWQNVDFVRLMHEQYRNTYLAEKLSHCDDVDVQNERLKLWHCHERIYVKRDYVLDQYKTEIDQANLAPVSNSKQYQFYADNCDPLLEDNITNHIAQTFRDNMGGKQTPILTVYKDFIMQTKSDGQNTENWQTTNNVRVKLKSVREATCGNCTKLCDGTNETSVWYYEYLCEDFDNYERIEIKLTKKELTAYASETLSYLFQHDDTAKNRPSEKQAKTFFNTITTSCSGNETVMENQLMGRSVFHHKGALHDFYHAMLAKLNQSRTSFTCDIYIDSESDSNSEAVPCLAEQENNNEKMFRIYVDPSTASKIHTKRVDLKLCSAESDCRRKQIEFHVELLQHCEANTPPQIEYLRRRYQNSVTFDHRYRTQ